MFAIMVPASLAPLIITLIWAERKAQRLGLVDVPPTPTTAHSAPKQALPTRVQTMRSRAWRFSEQLDLIGLTLLGAGVALILLPLTLSSTARHQWENGSIIAMLVVGLVSLALFAVWDLRFARRPVIARRFLGNVSVLGAAWIGFFDFVSFYLTFTYLYSFVLVVKPWSVSRFKLAIVWAA